MKRHVQSFVPSGARLSCRARPGRRLSLLAATLFAVLTATGCTTSRWYNYDFAPAPQEARVVDERVADSQARALVTISGIQKPRDGNPARVEVRMRLQNLGAGPFSLSRDWLELVSAGLQSFGPSSLALEEGVSLAPGDTIVRSFYFDLPRGNKPKDYNFEGAAFCWAIDFGAGPVTTSVSFQRLATSDPYYPYVGWGYGYPYPYYGVGYTW